MRDSQRLIKLNWSYIKQEFGSRKFQKLGKE